MLGQERRRRHAVMLLHEVNFGAALRQVNRVAEIVLLGERAHRLQQFRRRRLRQRGGREHADASPVGAMPLAEQLVDALHPLFAQLRREARRLALGEAFRRQRPGHVLAVANAFGEHPSQSRAGERGRVAADVAGELDHRRRAGANRFERADGGHQRGFFALQQAARLHRQLRGIGKAEVFVEPARERRAEMRVTVDEARDERLAAAVVDVGVGILLEDRIGRPDRRDAIALHRQRDVVLHAIRVDDRRVRKDDGPARGRLLALHAAWIRSNEGGGRGAGAGEQFTTGESAVAWRSLWRNLSEPLNSLNI